MLEKCIFSLLIKCEKFRNELHNKVFNLQHIVASATPLATAEKYLPQNLSPALRREICGYFFLLLSFFRSEVVMKKSSNDTFFCSKRYWVEKIII